MRRVLSHSSNDKPNTGPSSRLQSGLVGVPTPLADVLSRSTYAARVPGAGKTALVRKMLSRTTYRPMGLLREMAQEGKRGRTRGAEGGGPGGAAARAAPAGAAAGGRTAERSRPGRRVPPARNEGLAPQRARGDGRLRDQRARASEGAAGLEGIEEGTAERQMAAGMNALAQSPPAMGDPSCCAAAAV